MYVASWIFLAAAIGALAYGLSQPGLTFIYVSIGASVVAMLFLLVGVLRKKPVQPATAGAPYGPTPEEAAREAAPAEATAVTARPSARPAAAPEAPPRRKPAAAATEAAEAEEAAAPAATTTTTRKTTAKKAPAKKTAARAPSGQVVVIPERGTYHQSTCRFVKGRRDTERLTRTTAKRRGYSSCGVCKPDAA
jgi:hypothetical protein